MWNADTELSGIVAEDHDIGKVRGFTNFLSKGHSRKRVHAYSYEYNKMVLLGNCNSHGVQAL